MPQTLSSDWLVPVHPAFSCSWQETICRQVFYFSPEAALTSFAFTLNWPLDVYSTVNFISVLQGAKGGKIV